MQVFTKKPSTGAKSKNRMDKTERGISLELLTGQRSVSRANPNCLFEINSVGACCSPGLLLPSMDHQTGQIGNQFTSDIRRKARSKKANPQHVGRRGTLK